MRKLPTLAACSVVALSCGGGFHYYAAHAQNTPPATPPAVTSAAPTTQSSQQFAVGDQVKLTFYEVQSNTEADQWGRGGSGFQQRPELSGEFTVQDDGTLSFPLLGSFQVQGQTPQVLQLMLASQFEKVTKRKGFAAVMGVEHPPVYVLGPVKNPGAFKFAPGMTVFHAVALAGGFNNQGLEGWQQLEAVRETIKQRASYEALSELLARKIVLIAERDHIEAKPTQKLIDLVGEVQARGLVATEMARRQPIVEARRSASRTQADTLATVRQEVAQMSDKMGPLDALIRMRGERVAAFNRLMSQGTLGRPQIMQAQSDLADAELRKQDAVNQITMAKQRLGQLESEDQRNAAQIRGDLETAILGVEQQIAADTRESETSSGVLGALKVTPISFGSPQVSSDGDRATYEIVRQTPEGPKTIAASGTTRLRPGDLVRIAPKEAERVAPGGSAPHSISTQPAAAREAAATAPIPQLPAMPIADKR
jgi:protein involved in polysaccharide export with SLBB domain